MRIISGELRGRKLVDSLHLRKTLRPTTDMAREALFNILFSARSLREIGFDLHGAKILDVCCGSGAVAFEALSRGAKSAVLIDNNRKHLELVYQNAEALKVADRVKIMQQDAKKLPKNSEEFDLVFIDPPYREDYDSIVESLVNQGWIQKKSLIVIEFDTMSDLENISQFLKEVETRNYGKTAFKFLQLKD